MTDLDYVEMRTVGCLCGGVIKAPVNDHRAIAIAIGEHQATPRHLDWRMGVGNDADAVVGEALPVPEEDGRARSDPAAEAPVPVSRAKRGVVLGPCPCQGCGQPVVYAREWPVLPREMGVNLSAANHRIADEKAALIWRDLNGSRHGCHAQEAVA